MEIKVTLRGDPGAMGLREAENVAKAITRAFRYGGDLLKKRGRAAMGAGGLSTRFQNAFRVNVYPKSGFSSSPRIFAFHKIKWAGQFQDPQPVIGAPYVWLPIEKNLPGGTHWTPAKYAKAHGPLRGGHHGGKPLLFGQIAVSRTGQPLKRKPRAGSAIHKVWVPLFVGVRSVNDPKRFDLGIEAERVASEIDAGFSRAFDNG